MVLSQVLALAPQQQSQLQQQQQVPILLMAPTIVLSPVAPPQQGQQQEQLQRKEVEEEGAESVPSVSQLDAIDKASDGVNIDEIRDLVRITVFSVFSNGCDSLFDPACTTY